MFRKHVFGWKQRALWTDRLLGDLRTVNVRLGHMVHLSEGFYGQLRAHANTYTQTSICMNTVFLFHWVFKSLQHCQSLFLCIPTVSMLTLTNLIIINHIVNNTNKSLFPISPEINSYYKDNHYLTLSSIHFSLFFAHSTGHTLIVTNKTFQFLNKQF